MQNANQYVIYQYISKVWVEINTTSSTTFTVSGLAYEKPASFRVAAKNTSTGQTSNQTATLTVTPTRLPAVPAGLSGNSTSSGDGVTLSWTAATNAVSYEVYRHDGSNWVLIATTPNTSYTDITVMPATTYQFV